MSSRSKDVVQNLKSAVESFKIAPTDKTDNNRQADLLHFKLPDRADIRQIIYTHYG